MTTTKYVLIVLALCVQIIMICRPIRADALSSVHITSPTIDQKIVLSSTRGGTVEVSCSAWTHTYNTTDDHKWDSSIQWSCSTAPAGTTIVFDPTSGPNTTLKITGLPNNNSGFGNFYIIASASDTYGHMAQTQHRIKLYFPATAASHPGSDTNPNWYYYWTQALNNGPHSYDAMDDYGLTSTVNGSIKIGSKAYVNDNSLPRHNGVKYINAFGYIVSHEKEHSVHVLHNNNTHGGWNLPANQDHDVLDGQPDLDHVCDENSASGGWEHTEDCWWTLSHSHYYEWDPQWIAIQYENNPYADSDDWSYMGLQW